MPSRLQECWLLIKFHAGRLLLLRSYTRYTHDKDRADHTINCRRRRSGHKRVNNGDGYHGLPYSYQCVPGLHAATDPGKQRYYAVPYVAYVT